MTLCSAIGLSSNDDSRMILFTLAWPSTPGLGGWLLGVISWLDYELIIVSDT